MPSQLRFTPKAGWLELLELNARAVADGRTIFRRSGTLRGARPVSISAAKASVSVFNMLGIV
jgi:hypothetical protein